MKIYSILKKNQHITHKRLLITKKVSTTHHKETHQQVKYMVRGDSFLTMIQLKISRSVQNFSSDRQS
jgi:hypothetical protein